MPQDASPASPTWCLIGTSSSGGFSAIDIALAPVPGEPGNDVEAPNGDVSPGRPEVIGAPRAVSDADLAAFVREREIQGPVRWVWHDTALVYPRLLAAGVRVARCHDLRLSHQILRNSALVTKPEELRAHPEWDVPSTLLTPESSPPPTLFELEQPAAPDLAPTSADAALDEFLRQRRAISTATEPARLALLVTAESAGGLIAAELTTAGLPWDVAEHQRILTEQLGPRPLGGKPIKMLALASEVRQHLGDATAQLDSPPKLLSALRAAGIEVASTSKWELSEHEHPAIAPLLRYKQLARLLSANGWAWLDEWVHEGRYRPVYVPGGVVTGRWASNGGGALQLPRMLRPALRADPGWLFVSADVSQLEPRVLAAMSGDTAMAAAGFERDLYAGIVERGVVETREEAKFAMLGAMYGATSGESGRLMPHLRRAFPRAMGLVDDAAARGERGEVVSTWLGRTSPGPDSGWIAAQHNASLPGAAGAQEALARRIARDRGRFTRNFVVQGTAAEWALVWLAELRTRLTAMPRVVAEPGATATATHPAPAHASGQAFEGTPHLVFFLHDEVLVHTPAALADEVARAVHESAATAGRRLFGSSTVDFRLDLRITERATKE